MIFGTDLMGWIISIMWVFSVCAGFYALFMGIFVWGPRNTKEALQLEEKE